jgi:hypothetical protein
MTPELKAKWIEALRSGKFPQATGELKKIRSGEVVGFCCLGVLCELTGKDGPSQSNFGFLNDDTAKELGLPVASEEEVAKFVNGARSVNDLEGKSFQIRAAGRNDGGWTFQQLADWIEAQALEATP